MRKKSFQVLAVLVGLTFLAGILQSQTTTHPKSDSPASSHPLVVLPTATPEEVGLSSERLGRIARSIQADVDESRISGGVSLVARHGKVV